MLELDQRAQKFCCLVGFTIRQIQIMTVPLGVSSKLRIKSHRYFMSEQLQLPPTLLPLHHRGYFTWTLLGKQLNSITSFMF
jgi:hypothetical protein